MENLFTGIYPKKCPLCGKDSIHLLLFKPEKQFSAGGSWIWCSSCNKFSHASVVIPKWWRNFNDLEEDQLFASPEYSIDDKRDEIDKWINKLISEKESDSEEIIQTTYERPRFYVIRIEPQKFLSEEQIKIVEQVCRCDNGEALEMVEREGIVLHPMTDIDIGIVKKELEAKDIQFSINPYD